MTDGFMSAWSGPAAATRLDWAPSSASCEGASAQRLPIVHFHATTLMDIRRVLLFPSPPSTSLAFGVLRGFRSSPPEDNILFDSHLPQAAVGAIRPGAVVLPLGNVTIAYRPWREGRVGGDGSILKLFGATASSTLVDNSRGVKLSVSVALPNMTLFRWPALAPEESPKVAEVSLSIVLSGGDTVREGEHIGFLLRGKGDTGVLEPVLLNDTVGRRGIVGMWTLSERDLWTAAAVFAADSMTRRNAKVGLPGARPSLSSSATAKRRVRFVIAQFRERLGGPPNFLPCEVLLPSATETHHLSFEANVVLKCDEPVVQRGGVVSAKFTSDSLPHTYSAESGPHAGLSGGVAHATVPPSFRSEDRSGGGNGGDVARLRNLPEPNPLIDSEGVSPASQARLQLDDISEQMRHLNSEIGLVSSRPMNGEMEQSTNKRGQSEVRGGTSLGSDAATLPRQASSVCPPSDSSRRLELSSSPSSPFETRDGTKDEDTEEGDGYRSRSRKLMSLYDELSDHADDISPQLDQIARKYIGPGY